MTKEEIMNLSLEDVEARKAEIKNIVEDTSSEANFDELSAEVDLLEERKAFLVEEERKADILAVVEGAGTEETKIEVPVEERKMDLKEIRSSEEYMNAYAEYLKTNDDRECRALLTDMVDGGVVPVPTIIQETIETNWSKSDLLSLVKKTYLKSIIKVPFELEADPANVHVEGTEAPKEENLTFGIVTINAANLKKYIKMSDEVYSMKGEAFLRYIYDEITYQIDKLAEKLIIELIENAPGTASDEAVSVATVDADVITLGTVAEAISQLSDAATSPVIVMNKLTWAAFKSVQYAGNFNVDPFEGLRVIFNNDIKSYSDCEAGETYAIVGDFSGVQANFPDGEDVVIKFDELTYAPQDIILVLGKKYMGLGLVKDKFFTKIAKEAES